MKQMALMYVIFVAFTSIIPLRSVVLGGIPFWYDPARDLLLAAANLHKLTLIGPPGGIPGIFYGPYWIWLLSLPMIITKDPRLIVLFAITIPFLILFPLFLWKMRKFLGIPAVFILWALFIANFDSYLTFPWSPYLVSLVFIVLAYLITTNASAFLIGIVCALAPNFNFSFGLTVVFGTAVYELLTNWRKFPRFVAGVLLIYSPFIIFELRHGFMQTQAFIDTFVKSALYNSAMVGQVGIPKNEILSRLIAVPAGMLHLPPEIFIKVGAGLLILGILKGLLRERLTWFLCSVLASLLLIYFSTKNPVWPYQFIGVETIFLLFFGLLMSKSRVLTILAGGVSLWLLISTFVSFVHPLVPNYLTLPTLASKENITRVVISDAKDISYRVFAYSPAIYTFDYDYLFGWLEKKPRPSDTNVYLIIPPATEAVQQDFIHYKTSDDAYQTVWEKKMPDGTIIVKRAKTT